MCRTFEIDKIEYAHLSALNAEGISAESVRLCFIADMNDSGERAECPVFATDTEIIIIEGEALIGKKSQKVFKVKKAKRYALSELFCFEVEELLSTARLTAQNKSGERILVCSFSNFCKVSAQIFAKYVGKIEAGKELEIDDSDRSENTRCPMCSRRYPAGSGFICPHCKSSVGIFGRMWKFFGRYKVYLLLMILSFYLLTAAGILAPYLSSGFFYDEVLREGGSFYGKVITVLLMVISVKCITQIATMVNNYVTSVIAAKVTYDLKLRIFSSIERLSVSFFADSQTGGLMSQITSDAKTIYRFFCDTIPYFLIHAVQVAAIAVLLFVLSPMLALISLATVPVYIFVLRLTFRTEWKFHNRSFSATKSMRALLSDFLTGIRVVKSFSRESEERERFSELNKKLAEADRQGSEFRNTTAPIASFILYLGNILALGFGGYACIKGELSYGTLLTVIAYMGMIYQPMHFFTSVPSAASGCMAALSRLFQIDDAKSEITEREDAEDIKNIRGEIEFRDVSFSYNRSRRVIDSVSFKVSAGETLGIVGRTGAGKTTLANLIMRLYEPQHGDIFIDGKNIKDLTLSSIYENVAIVSQETHIFVGTVLDNIRYACPDATLEDVIEAARRAGAHEFIMKLPDAYMERVGFGYKDLSGGEKQRISIARALLKKPEILILDEATAAMDTKTEQMISNALDELTENKTTIIIAHRLSTLKGADRLIVIDDGRIVESGTHKELLDKKGVYHKLYTLQDEALKRAGVSVDE